MICPHCGKETGNTLVANALMPGMANAAQPVYLNLTLTASQPAPYFSNTVCAGGPAGANLCSGAYNPPTQTIIIKS